MVCEFSFPQSSPRGKKSWEWCRVSKLDSDEHSGDNYSEQLSAKILFLFAFEFGTEQEKISRLEGMWEAPLLKGPLLLIRCRAFSALSKAQSGTWKERRRNKGESLRLERKTSLRRKRFCRYVKAVSVGGNFISISSSDLFEMKVSFCWLTIIYNQI